MTPGEFLKKNYLGNRLLLKLGNGELEEILESYHQYKQGQERNENKFKTLRDEFAMSAINETLADTRGELDYHRAVDIAYHIADSMIERRKTK